MDLQAYREHINQLDNGIAALLVRRSEYPLDCMVSGEIQDNDFYKSLLRCVCHRGRVSERDMETALEIGCVLKAALDIRFGFAGQIVDYKRRHGPGFENWEREAINNAGTYAAGKGKDPEPYRMAFRIIINGMKAPDGEHSGATNP